jgi:hypothetical protein
MESKDYGVLDPRFRGDDGFFWSSAQALLCIRHARIRASIYLGNKLSKEMDHRVKPGDDDANDGFCDTTRRAQRNLTTPVHC